MSRLEFLLNQPFEDASNRGYKLLLLAGMALLALVAAFGRDPLLLAAVAAYLLSIPAYVAVRNRTWNESLADVDATTGREEASVAGFEGGPEESDQESG